MRALLRRLRFLLLARRHERELAEELALHRELKARELADARLTPADARWEARRAMGNELSARQYARDVWIRPWLQEIAQDGRFALRLLPRDRGFALTAIVVLGLGIGVNNMMFTIIYSHTMRGLPIPRADRVYYISAFDDRASDRPLSYPELVDVRAASTFEAVGAFVSVPITVADDGRVPDRFDGAYVTANAIDVIGRPPILGRSFGAHEDTPVAPLVALVGSGAWRSRYAGDPTIVGRTIHVNGVPATVIGVMPERSGFPSTAEVWLPLAQMPGLATERRDARMLRVFGRLRDGAHADNARLEIETIIARTASDHPETSRNLRARIVPINVRFLGRPTDPAWIAFLLAGFLVLAVSAANVANLMLARAATRTRELAIRRSLGASRWRVLRQMLTESIVLAGLGGAIAVGVSLAGVRVFASLIPENTLPYWTAYTMDTRVLLALVAVAFATVLVFGVAPALHASRLDVMRVLRDGGRSGTGTRSNRRWTTAFLTLQFALTVVLLVNAVVAIRSRGPGLPSDATVRTTAVLTASISLPAAAYASPEQRSDFYRRLDERLGGTPGVDSASVTIVMPSHTAPEQRLELEGRTRGAGEEAPVVASLAVGPRYFETLDLAMPRGREFDDGDGAPGRAHAIVNQRFVEMFLAGGDPIGRRIALVPPSDAATDVAWLTIVGVAPNIQQRPTAGVRDSRGVPLAEPLVYVPFLGAKMPTASLLVRSSLSPADATARVRSALHALDPHLPLYRARTLARAIDDARWNLRVSARLVFSITLLAFGLSIVGLYAVTAHAVAQRTQELGVRIALGARPWQVTRTILRGAVLQTALGLALGIPCTILWDSAIFTRNVDLRMAAPANVLVVAVLLSGAVLLACFGPARRATRLDPVVALRAE